MYIDNKRLYTLCFVLFAVLLTALFIPFYSKIVIAGVLVIAAVAIFVWVKKRSILSLYKKEVTLIVAVLALVLLLAYYLSGLKFGFFASPKRLTWTTLFKDLLPTLVMIVCIEVIRYVFLAQKKPVIEVVGYLSCIAVDVLIYTNVPFVQSFNSFMTVIGLNLLPAVLNNLAYNYISRRYGIYPNILFRVIFAVYPFVLSVVPLMPDSLLAFCKLLMPLLLMWFIRTLYDTKSRVTRRKNKKLAYVSFAVMIVLMIGCAMLISCQFRWGIIVVGSESMTGEFNKGDAVIYESYRDQKIEEGQVIVFMKDGVQVIHRVMTIRHVNGVTRYYTKGDTNEEMDYGYITDSDIKGLAEIRVRYIGYPTIWVRQLFS